MKGIDISNWQEGTDISTLDIDFLICKATEGTDFVDWTFNDFVQQAMLEKKLFGYYHFAGNGDAKEEAFFFWNNTLGYTGVGIPVLDYEVWGKWSDISWCEQFMERYHEISGVWPVLYISASHCKDFVGSWIPEVCKLWVAGYPAQFTDWYFGEMPYDISPWNEAVIWQFTSSLFGKFDGNISYIDANEWLRMTKPDANKEESEVDMHCLIKPDGADGYVYYDGVNLHGLDHPDEAHYIGELYKEVTGKEIPVIEFGTKEAPKFHRVADAISHGWSQPHMG